MDRLTAAKVFVDVVQSGSFSATAERLDMSRPMVTRYIEAMENWLQTRLLHRTTRKISLTTAGESCLEKVETWLEQAEVLMASTATAESLSGTIRVATSMSFGYSQLIPAIKHFMALYPAINIDVDLEDSVVDFTERQIDLAIRIASDPEPSLIGKPIATCESVLVASPEYLASMPVCRHPDDLVLHHCVGYKNFQRHLWHLSQGDNFVSVDIQCRLTANETTTLLHAALQGIGIAFQPTYLVNHYLKSGELIQLLPDWKPSDLTIYALYSSRKHLSPMVRALIDHLESYFAVNPW